MTPEDLRALIAGGETLTVEFKSDQGPLSDADLVETAVCLANAQGGTLLIGVEDDGRVTGLHPRHRTHPSVLAAFVANRTVPPVSAEADFVNLPEGSVAVLRVSPAYQPVATSEGRLLIRYTDAHGRPGCRPQYPHELPGWRADRGTTDVSALPVPGATWADLDPLEFVRLRRMVEENRGDIALLELSDEEIARALGLVRVEDGVLVPTLTGLLIVGREAALRDRVPTHEVAFQVLHGADVAFNEFRRWPLLHIHEWIMQAIDVRNEEQELMVDSFRVGVPRYDRRGIREAINNALIHRDYGQLGAIHIQLHEDYALIANPGGFVVGVHAGNLLTVAPRPRNPLLADAFKRVGLVEKTGRGVGIIYVGQLQNGRPAPTYDRSSEASVTVTLDSRPGDLGFVLLSVRANRQLGRAVGVEGLLILWELWQRQVGDAHSLAPILQRDVTYTDSLLAVLAQAGLLRAEGTAYRLEPKLRAETRRRIEAAPVDPEVAILSYVQHYGRITRREVMELCQVDGPQAYRLLKKQVDAGRLRPVGPRTGRGAAYELNRNA